MLCNSDLFKTVLIMFCSLFVHTSDQSTWPITSQTFTLTLQTNSNFIVYELHQNIHCFVSWSNTFNIATNIKVKKYTWNSRFGCTFFRCMNIFEILYMPTKAAAAHWHLSCYNANDNVKTLSIRFRHKGNVPQVSLLNLMSWPHLRPSTCIYQL